MPLSRLSARRNRNTLLPQRSKSGSGNAGQNQAASRHLNLWEAIRRTRDELAQWQARVDQVNTLFHHSIVPREHRLTDAYCDLTDALMSQFAITTLSPADRSLVGLWITDNLRSLANHPFVTPSYQASLLNQWAGLVDVDGPIENQLMRLARQHALFLTAGADTSHDPHASDSQSSCSPTADVDDEAAAHDDEEEDVVFDFGWHKNSSASSTTKVGDASTAEDSIVQEEKTQRDSFNTNGSDDDTDDQSDAADHRTVDETVSTLEKNLSVDKLFRQLARVLHPDREQDEALKAEKHTLMSQCLKARQEKDINTLLTLYCEHVGELPDNLNDASHEELITALQLQLSQLQQEFRGKRFGDPLLAQIVERYGDSDNAVCEKRVAHHAKSLDIEIQQISKKTKSIQTSIGLQDALLERRAIEQDRMAIDDITGIR